MKRRPLLEGLRTFLPGWRYRTGTGGSGSASYCYSVWLRHLCMAYQNGLYPNPPVIAELGPGDSLGIGLAALISGCEKYYALDLVKHAAPEKNLAIFDELVNLFKRKAPIPGNEELPHVEPKLDDYRFPADLLDEARMREALAPERLMRIRSSIMNLGQDNPVIQYKVPWYSCSAPERGSVDMIFSQAVLEHVDNLETSYQAMNAWLKPSGYFSHTIDFRCHETAAEWNGHWAYSDFTWRLIRGRRPYLLNREPHSTHIHMMAEAGFAIVCDKRIYAPAQLRRSQLARKFRNISDEDLVTCVAFIQGGKTRSGPVA